MLYDIVATLPIVCNWVQEKYHKLPDRPAYGEADTPGVGFF